MATCVIAFLLVALTTGCSPNGPTSASETSATRPNLRDRIAFLEGYVAFRRTYLDLEYDVMYQDNGGGLVPGPSDWDIKILAVVPEDEIGKWIPAGAEKTKKGPPSWLTAMPGSIVTSKVTEWYDSGSMHVGIDRATSTVAYRSSSMPIN